MRVSWIKFLALSLLFFGAFYVFLLWQNINTIISENNENSPNNRLNTLLKQPAIREKKKSTVIVLSEEEQKEQDEIHQERGTHGKTA